jgi:di/tricarboxylate transporter
MTIHSWFTLLVLGAMFYSLVREIVAADVAVFGALTLLWASGVLDTREALAGFGNSGLLTVGFLFVVSQAMQETGALRRMSDWVLGNRLHRRRGMAQMVFSVAAISAFVNNTPLVAIFTPAVREWAVARGKAPSKFLMPLSFAAILGGTCTLIGTSTNLVVSGLLEQYGMDGFGMFELSVVGLPITLVGGAFLVLFSRYLLPDRRSPAATMQSEAREYSVRLDVTADCPLIGKTIENAGLRRLEGLYLAEIERGTHRIAPVRPTTRVMSGDRLVLYGVAETVVELRKVRGLIPVDDATDDDDDDITNTISEDTADEMDRASVNSVPRSTASNGDEPDRQLFEVVVSSNSPLIGGTLKSAGFRRRYDAAVIAIQRNGERVREKLGQVVLEAGDTLMVEGSPGFRTTWGASTDFYLVSEVAQSELPRHALANLSLGVMVLMVTAMATDVAEPALAAAVAAVLLIVSRCVRVSSARSSVDLSVMVVIAAAFGISKAVSNSGLAEVVSSAVVAIGVAKPALALGALYIMTAFFTEVLTNNAAAALSLPVALQVAEKMEEAGFGGDPRPYAVAVAIAASMSFVTPIGYQTNLMVYGPGGYKFGDFARLGAPLTILAFVVAMFVIPWVWPLRV